MCPSADKSSILPLSNYIGKYPDPDKDIYDRRTIVEHDPFSFNVQTEKDEPEAIRNLKRFPKGVMNTENLTDLLSSDSEKLNLESCYWLSNHIIGTIGKMAVNLKELSLRRMPEVSNMAFREIFEHLHKLEIVDFSDSTGLHSSAL